MARTPVISVVIPWRPGCPHRQAALEWVQARYTVERPEYEVVVGIAGGDVWRKAEAVRDGLERCRGDVVAVVDADIWVPLTAALERVEERGGWAIPHKLVHRLSEDSTARVLDGAEWRGLPLDDADEQDSAPYVGVAGGGAVVAHRSTLLEIPLDPRFGGWGQEDVAHAIALTTMTGRPWRGTEDLVHLWHPPQERPSRRTSSRESTALLRQYQNARNRPKRMAALIAEGQALR